MLPSGAPPSSATPAACRYRCFELICTSRAASSGSGASRCEQPQQQKLPQQHVNRMALQQARHKRVRQRVWHGYEASGRTIPAVPLHRMCGI